LKKRPDALDYVEVPAREIVIPGPSRFHPDGTRNPAFRKIARSWIPDRGFAASGMTDQNFS